MASTQTPARLLTMAEAAEWLNVSPDTVRRMIARGELQARRYGPRLIRIDPAEVQAASAPVTSLAELRAGDAR